MEQLNLGTLIRDVGLAAVAAFTGAILASASPDKAMFIAGGYAALRAAAGVIFLWASNNRSK